MGAEQALSGRVAVVTGAGRGIGASVARALASAGASTILTARSKEGLDQVADVIRADGGDAEVVPGELADLSFVDAFFDGVAARHGRLDILVNNAGVSNFAPIEEVPPAAFREMLDVNTVAPYACMRRAVMLMRAGNDDGCIVNVGSTEAYWTASGESGVYPATKFALRALALGVSKELKTSGSGIRICMVNPGGVDTRMANPDGELNPKLLDPDDVARSVLHVVTAPPGVHVFDTIVVAQPYFSW